MTVDSKKSVFKPDLVHEQALSRLHGGLVAGIDEAGRGPWAGPVVAAAVILIKDHFPKGLDDSKRLTGERREVLFEDLMKTALVGVGIVEVDEIDRVNILQATMNAMRQAFDALPEVPQAALIDGNRSPALPCPTQALVKGDQRAASIAAASIIAKVTRDRLMARIGADFPLYGFEKHKGYGTKAHQQALTTYGITPHHRRSFKPVRQLLNESGTRF